MTPSILEVVGINCKDKSTKELKNYLHESLNIYLFDIIFDKFTLGEESSFIIWYILYAYTEESPFLINNANAIKEKDAICDRVQMPEYLRDKVINLNDEAVRKAVIDHVDYFAGYEFKTLQFMKTQYDDIMGMIIRKDFHEKVNEDSLNGLGEKTTIVKFIFDVKKYFEAEGKVENLGKRIAKLEAELKNRHKWRFLPELVSLKKASQGQNPNGRRIVAPEGSSSIN